VTTRAQRIQASLRAPSRAARLDVRTPDPPSARRLEEAYRRFLFKLIGALERETLRRILPAYAKALPSSPALEEEGERGDVLPGQNVTSQAITRAGLGSPRPGSTWPEWKTSLRPSWGSTRLQGTQGMRPCSRSG
jgi:hypothetical protein